MQYSQLDVALVQVERGWRGVVLVSCGHCAKVISSALRMRLCHNGHEERLDFRIALCERQSLGGFRIPLCKLTQHQ